MAFEDDWNELWDTIIGRTEKDLGKKAQKLAEESQQFNEQFSEKQFKQQQKQFEKSQELAENNLQFQKESADRNFQMQQDVFNAQQRENELTRQREDTAYQRQVADLKAAGLSPLMASNGAAATNVQVGETPQFDSSGVQNAYGSYIQMAKEFAELKNMAAGQYLSRRQEAINQRIGATMALAQMSQSRRQMYWNNALSGFNLAANISSLRKRNMLLDEQIQNAKDTRTWSNKYGWRNLNNWAVLGSAIKDLGSALNISKKDILDVIGSMNPSNITNIYNQGISEMYDGTEEGFSKLKNKVEVLKGSTINKSNFDSMIKVITQKQEVNQETIETWYKQMNNQFKKNWSFSDFKSALTGNKFYSSALFKYLMFGDSI